MGRFCCCSASLRILSKFRANLFHSVIALTRCANRKAGYCACFFLLIMGIFSKFAAALVAIPASVLGGMTTFLFSAVAVSGIRIISTVPFTRRNRFILTAAMSLGFGATLVPNWFSFVFTYNGGGAKGGFFNAIVLVLETGFAVTAFLAIFLNLILDEEIEDEAASITADDEDARDDAEEWARIRKGSKVAAAQAEEGMNGSPSTRADLENGEKIVGSGKEA